MKKRLLSYLLIFLFYTHSTSACLCDVYSFCELTDNNSLILEAEVISKYEAQSASSFLIRYLDFKVTEALQNTPSFEFFSNYMIYSCHEGYELKVGDKIVVNFFEDSNPQAPDANYLTTSFFSCRIHYLKISSDGNTVNGLMEQNLFETNYENFKTDLGKCHDYTYVPTEIIEPEPEPELPFLTVFPNPTTESITVSFGEIEINNIEFELFASNGKLLNKENTITENVYNLDVSNLPVGVYILRVRYNEEELIERIVKY